MSTRGAWGFIISGRKKVTMCAHASYPTGLGREVIKFIQNHTDEELTEIAKRIELVQINEPATPDQIRTCLAVLPTYEGDGPPLYSKDWATLLDDVADEPEYYADGLLYMIDAAWFLKDPLFCEWAYLIDMKEKQLLVRVGESGKKRMRLVSRIPFERWRECSQKHIHDITEVMEHERDEE